MKVRLKDIAEKTGLSLAVVSRVMNPMPDKNAVIAESTRERVLKIAQEMGYKRNRTAEFLARGKSPAIGVFLPNIANSLIADIMIGMSTQSSAKSFPLNFYFGFSKECYDLFLTEVKDNQHSGIVTYPNSFISEPSIRAKINAYLKEGGKIVFIKPYNFDFAPKNSVCVGVDDIRGGEMAALQLKKHACSHYLFCGEHTDRSSPRTRGFLETLVHEQVSCLKMNKLKAFLDHEKFSVKAPLGVFAENDAIALKIMKQVVAKGYRIGKEVKIVGYDDQTLTGDLPVPLTTIHQPFNQVGSLAIEKIISLVYGKKAASEILSPSLVVRESA